MKVVIFSIAMLIVFASPGYGEMYRWVDEKGTVHFTDNPSNIPEKYRQEVETRKPPKETSSPQPQEKAKTFTAPKVSEPEGMTVDLVRKRELLLAEVVLNGSVRQHFIVDTGASFTLINRQTARGLGLTVDENTPRIPVTTVSDIILTPLVTLKSVRVGNTEVENVDALIYDMPSESPGLLGNSFLNKFKVVLDSINSKMTLFPLQGTPSPERPAGYSRDYWTSRFRFYHQNLEDLKKLREKYEARGNINEMKWVSNTIRYFEDQLSELDRRASFAGVPRNWRQ